MSALHPESQFYLHDNGSVLYKPHGGVEEDSPFVIRVWNANYIGQSPQTYLNWLKELEQLNTPKSEIRQLVHEQNLTEFISNVFEKLELEVN